MKKATWGAYTFILTVMFPTAITGYWAFGNGMRLLHPVARQPSFSTYLLCLYASAWLT